MKNINIFIPRDNGLEGVCFKSEDMREGSENYATYRAISDAMHDSGLSHDFAYKVAEKACDIIDNLGVDYKDDYTEALDQAVPVYTHEIMEIYACNGWIVDEAVEELGNIHDNSEDKAKVGWFKAIDNMVEAIKNNLK